MRLVSHILESIRRMGSDNNSTTDISEWLHIGHVHEAYGSIDNVNYIQLMFKHDDRSTSLDNMKVALSYLALQGLYDSDSARIFNLLFTADKWQNTCRTYLLCWQHCQDTPFLCPVTKLVHYLR